MALLAYYDNTDGTRKEAELKTSAFYVHFRRCKDYDGGFGFDWMRDEYIYETKDLVPDYTTDDEYKEEVAPSICLEKTKLMLQYKTELETREKPYFIPWLSMFANHEQKIGTKVKLQLKVEIVDLRWKKSKIKFECPAGIQVIPSEIELTRKDTIEQTTKGIKNKEYTSTEIEIVCSQQHTGGIIIAKNIPAKGGTEESVGWLNLFANNKEYSLHIRLVKFLRTEHLETDKAFFNEHIEKIKTYLKTKSLQQAMVVPEIEIVKEIVISEQQWKNEGIFIEIDDPDDYSETGNKVIAIADNTDKAFVKKYREIFEYKEEEVVVDEEYEEYEEFQAARKDEKYKDNMYIFENGEANNGEKIIKKRTPFIGVVVLLTNMDCKSSGIGGMGSFYPQNNECFITRTGITKDLARGTYYSSLSHEIGHVLGLDHTFENTLNRLDITPAKYKKYKNDLETGKLLLLDEEKKIVQYHSQLNALIKKEKKTNLSQKEIEEKVCCKKEISSSSHTIIICKHNDLIYSKWIEDYEHFQNNLNGNLCYFFTTGMTDNMMDYGKLKSKTSLLNSFFYWQWKRIHNDIVFHQTKGK